MYIYIYVILHIYIHIHVLVYIHIHMYLYIYIYVHIYIYTSRFVHISLSCVIFTHDSWYSQHNIIWYLLIMFSFILFSLKWRSFLICSLALLKNCSTCLYTHNNFTHDTSYCPHHIFTYDSYLYYFHLFTHFIFCHDGCFQNLIPPKVSKSSNT